MTLKTLSNLVPLAIAISLPIVFGCPGALRSAGRTASSTVSGAGSTARTAANTGIGAVHTAIAIPAGWTEIQWKEERAVAKEESKSLEKWDGQRAQIKTKGTGLAAMPMKASAVEPRVAFILDDLLLTEFYNAGFHAIGPDDINDMIGFEAMKEELGSEETTNLSEFGNALGVAYLSSGSIANLEGSTVITLKIINVEEKIVIARVSAMGEGEIRQLPRLIAEAVTDLVNRSSL